MNATLPNMLAPDELTIRHEVILDGVVVLTLAGQLVVRTRDHLKQLVVDLLAEGYTRFIVDCEDVTYMDSSGLGVLISLAKRIVGSRGTFRVSCLNDDLATLFALTKIDTILRPYATIGDALLKE
jgi:anti-sigma B factor antagonist